MNIGRPKNKRDLIRISTHIPYAHHSLLKEISDEEDLSMGQVFRRAVEMYLISQKDVLGIEENDLAMAKHISETRSKKAQLINQTLKFEEIRNNMNLEDNFDFLESGTEIFEELNPAAFN